MLQCDDRFTHAFTALRCVFRVEIAKRCRFHLIEKFLLKTQNVAAFKVSQRKTATENLGNKTLIFTIDVSGVIFLSLELYGTIRTTKTVNPVTTLLQSHTVISKLKTKLHAVITC